MSNSKATKKAFRYWLDGKVRAIVMWIMNRITADSSKLKMEIRGQDIKKILLVRSLFRMGDAILATPAIFLFRKNFPGARIDFVGSRLSKRLFENLPIDHHYEVYRRFPKVCWSYLMLLTRLRATQYDLAVDVSCSSAALGSFVVGFSGARCRVGLGGKWDRWFNIRLPRPETKNKYGNLPELVASMGLESQIAYPKIILSPEEMAAGRKRIRALTQGVEAPVVGVFVGGRKARGKRWPTENFLQLATKLGGDGVKPVIFVGPEEMELLSGIREVLSERVPVIFEPDARVFASLVANCGLFVACDSGPVHLACALRVRTVAIFLNNNFDHWGPPANLGRVVYDEMSVSVDDVLNACRDELTFFPPVQAEPIEAPITRDLSIG